MIPYISKDHKLLCLQSNHAYRTAYFNPLAQEFPFEF